MNRMNILEVARVLTIYGDQSEDEIEGLIEIISEVDEIDLCKEIRQIHVQALSRGAFCETKDSGYYPKLAEPTIRERLDRLYRQCRTESWRKVLHESHTVAPPPKVETKPKRARVVQAKVVSNPALTLRPPEKKDETLWAKILTKLRFWQSS